MKLLEFSQVKIMANEDNMSTEVVENQAGEEDDEEGGIRIGDIYIPPPPAPACTFDSKGPRLIITHIENEYFKSYAGKQTLGPFHKSFTSIVGPNGSGKSNVIDSMLFVFGYRAQKIRSKKIGVLIHNSKNHQSINSCTVTVYFKKIIDLPGDGFEEVANSSFDISRTAFRDNTSYYCINNRRCQFKEVAKLLRQHGIDLDHNRFLILQGEVEQIAMMKPKSVTEHDTGMLEYLEDIIGSSRFVDPIEILNKRVEELNEQRTEKLNRVKMVEKEKDDLEGEKNEALEYLRKENEIFRVKNIFIQRNLLEFTDQQKEATEKKQEIEEGMNSVLDKIIELSSKSEAKDKEYKNVAATYDNVTKELETAKTKFNSFETKDIGIREDLRHIKAKQKKLIQLIQKENDHVVELEQVPEKMKSEIKELETRLSVLKRDQKREEDEVAKALESFRKETKDLQEEKDVNEAKLMELTKDVNETKSKMDLAQSELDIYASKEQNEKNRLEEMQRDCQQVCSSMEEKRKTVTKIEKRIPELQKSVRDSNTQFKKVTTEEEELSNKLRYDRLKMEEARSAMQATRSQNKVLNAIMAEKANGRISGIFGRLGDLGAIDEKYDIAISTACGALDNIVTDTIDTAQKCVNYLKTNNFGSATFIALDKMNRWKDYASRKVQTPEKVPRLFDLVRTNDDRFAPAFYFALRDTLVANDLSQATRIAFQGSTRYRVVTLKGELIDLSGTMSGGGGRVMKGRMGQSVVATTDCTRQQLDEMSARVNEMTQRNTELRRCKAELELKLGKETREGEQLERERGTLIEEIEALVEKEVLLTKNIRNQEDRVQAAAPDKKVIKQLESALAVTKKDYDKSAEVASTVQAEVQRLHDIIMEVSGKKTKAAQRILDKINKKIEDVDKAITKDNVAITIAERTMTQTKRKIKNAESERSENVEKIKMINEELAKLESEGRDLLEQIENMKTTKEDEEKKVGEAKKEARLFQSELANLNTKKMQADHKLEHCNKNISEITNRIKQLTRELSRLQLHEIEGEVVEPLATLTEEELRPKDAKECMFQVSVIEDQMSKKKIDLRAIEEYKKKEKQYLERAAELDDVTERRNTQRQAYEDLRKQRLNEFMTGFGIISSKLKEMYQMITLGGDAELELVDSLDPFSEGIVFSVRPPRKSWKNISNLSGGEKTLSSLALVFALHYYKPTPLYVMDEIDAALDFRNVSIVGNYIKERTRNAQFIVISLRNNMFELADLLVGIYKTHDCTQSVTINPSTITLQPLEDDIAQS